MKINKKQLNKGFTMIEAMVAIFILTIALSSLINLTARSMFVARYARNEITANYLAQEAADYIRNQRDTIAFHKNNGGDWNQFLNKFGYPSSSCFSTRGCYFGVNDTTDITLCPTLGCPFLKYKENGNSYYYYNNSGQNSIFSRKVEMKQSLVNQDEVYVTVTVSWKNGNSPTKEKILRFSLLNWLP